MSDSKFNLNLVAAAPVNAKQFPAIGYVIVSTALVNAAPFCSLVLSNCGFSPLKPCCGGMKLANGFKFRTLESELTVLSSEDARSAKRLSFSILTRVKPRM